MVGSVVAGRSGGDRGLTGQVSQLRCPTVDGGRGGPDPDRDWQRGLRDQAGQPLICVPVEDGPGVELDHSQDLAGIGTVLDGVGDEVERRGVERPADVNEIDATSRGRGASGEGKGTQKQEKDVSPYRREVRTPSMSTCIVDGHANRTGRGRRHLGEE